MKRFVKVIFSILCALILASCDEVNKRAINDIHIQVIEDFTKQYEIAKRQGDKITICVNAGLVSAAYLQAHDEGNYKKWKSKELRDCANAGL